MKTKPSATEVKNNLSMNETANKDAENLSNESFNKMNDETSENEKETFTRKSSSIQFAELEEGSILTGTYCGSGKTINEGDTDEVKTHLIFDRDSKEMVLLPQWQSLDKLNSINGEGDAGIGKQVVQVVYKGKVFDEKVPTKVKYHRCNLLFSNVQAKGDNAFSEEQLMEIRKEWEESK